MFSTLPETNLKFSLSFILSSATAFNLDKPKIFSFGKGLNIDEMMISVFDRVENTEGKGENADYQHFLLFPQCFPKTSSFGLLKVGIVWYRLK